MLVYSVHLLEKFYGRSVGEEDFEDSCGSAFLLQDSVDHVLELTLTVCLSVALKLSAKRMENLILHQLFANLDMNIVTT